MIIFILNFSWKLNMKENGSNVMYLNISMDCLKMKGMGRVFFEYFDFLFNFSNFISIFFIFS